jgi:hypothetical protein
VRLRVPQCPVADCHCCNPRCFVHNTRPLLLDSTGSLLLRHPAFSLRASCCACLLFFEYAHHRRHARLAHPVIAPQKQRHPRIKSPPPLIIDPPASSNSIQLPLNSKSPPSAFQSVYSFWIVSRSTVHIQIHQLLLGAPVKVKPSCNHIAELLHSVSPTAQLPSTLLSSWLLADHLHLLHPRQLPLQHHQLRCPFLVLCL